MPRVPGVMSTGRYGQFQHSTDCVHTITHCIGSTPMYGARYTLEQCYLWYHFDNFAKCQVYPGKRNSYVESPSPSKCCGYGCRDAWH